jgi:hypothetical protein
MSNDDQLIVFLMLARLQLLMEKYQTMFDSYSPSFIY